MSEEQTSTGARAGTSLPDALQGLLGTATVRAWRTLAPVLPNGMYLGGGTAVAVHLLHRESRDLDFFFHKDAVDLERLSSELGGTGAFAVTYESAGTLRGVFGETKVEFFHADEVRPQHLLEKPSTVAGLPVAGLKDLMAMKLKVVGDRGEMRDYYDIMLIEQRAGLTVEDGLALLLERYALSSTSDSLAHIISALGYLDDLEEDDSIPVDKAELSEWWTNRQRRLLRNLARQSP